MSASSSVLELSLLARSSSEFSKLFSSPVLGNEVRFLNTSPLPFLIKKLFVCLSSVLNSTVDLRVCHVSGCYSKRTVLLAFPGEFWWELEQCRSPISFGLPRPNVLFFTVALSASSGTVGLLLSVGGVSGSLPDSILYTSFCFDGDFVNRKCGPLGAVPLLLQSWSKSVIGLLIQFLCIIIPFGVVTVCFVPETAIFGLSV